MTQAVPDQSLLATVLEAALVVGRARRSKIGITWAQLDTLADAVTRLDNASGPSVPLAVTCPECGADYEAARAKNERIGRAVPISDCPNSLHGHSEAWNEGGHCCWCAQRKPDLQQRINLLGWTGHGKPSRGINGR